MSSCHQQREPLVCTGCHQPPLVTQCGQCPGLVTFGAGLKNMMCPNEVASAREERPFESQELHHWKYLEVKIREEREL